MLKTLLVLIAIASFGLVAALAVLNFVDVPFHFLLGKSDVPLSLLIIGIFILGLFMAFALDAMLIYRQRRRISKLEKTIAVNEGELSNLRKMPLKDIHG